MRGGKNNKKFCSSRSAPGLIHFLKLTKTFSTTMTKMENIAINSLFLAEIIKRNSGVYNDSEYI